MRPPELTPALALDRLAAHLRGGGTVLDGLRDLAGDDGVLAAELAEVVARVDAGASLAESLGRWRDDRPHPSEAGIVAGALEVAHTVGGRVAAPLEGLAGALRDRADVARELRAQSAQARLSAFVVGLAPIGVVALSVLGDGRVVGALVGTDPGRACLVAGVALEALAAAWMGHILMLGQAMRRRRATPAVEREAPLVADLLAMALEAGLTPYLALEVAARYGPPVTAGRCRAVLAAAAHRRLGEALEAEAARSPDLAALLEVLAASERFGTPAGPCLARLAADGRARLRQAAMVRARTVPVRLLFPLVFLVLPAFLVLTVVPVLLAGLTR